MDWGIIFVLFVLPILFLGAFVGYQHMSSDVKSVVNNSTSAYASYNQTENFMNTGFALVSKLPIFLILLAALGVLVYFVFK